MNKGAENPKPKEGIGAWTGKDTKTLTHHYGQTDRSYPYKNGLKDYVFKQKDEYYTVSTNKGIIISAHVTGEGVKVSPPETDESPSYTFEDTSVNPEPIIKTRGRVHKFGIFGEDPKTWTLIKYGDAYAQIYSDQQTSKTLAVRFLNADTLAALQPYKLNRAESEGQTSKSSDDKTPHEQNPNQLVTLHEVTSRMREMENLESLKINNDIARITTINLHEATDKGSDSMEFAENALTQQLDEHHVSYKSASRNVGYSFDDVPTLIHSWINSNIHRLCLLSNEYDETGGEVMGDHYPLIFVKK